MDLAAIREALASTITQAIPALRCYGFVPDSPAPSCAIVRPAPGILIDYQMAMAQGLCDINFEVQLLVQAVSDRAWQTELDGYLSAGTGGRPSVIDAIHANRTLGGVVSDATVYSVQDYGTVIMPDGGTRYGTATVVLIVRTPRT